MTNEDAKYLLDNLGTDSGVDWLASNAYLLEFIYRNALLDKSTVDRLFDATNENLFSRVDFYAKHCYDPDEGTYTVTDERIDETENFRKLSALYKDLLEFEKLSSRERQEILNIALTSSTASDKLQSIINNHLENEFNFEKLMQYLNKKEKKNLLNI